MKLEQLEQRQLLSSALDGGILRILTGATADVISIKASGSDLLVEENGAQTTFALADITGIQVETGDGNDLVQAPDIAIPIQAILGGGVDSLFSGSAADTIYGGDGGDLIVTGDGADVVYGEGGGDRIITGAGTDTVTGGGGGDSINTGSTTDTVYDSGRNINRGKGNVFVPLSRVVGYEPQAYLSTVSGYDPNQIRTAYGFRDLDGLEMLDWARLPGLQADFERGRDISVEDLAMLQTAWDYGYGQTIYIVDAYTGLNVESDFQVFCEQFGLPTPTAENFQIVNVRRGTPAIEPLWAAEIQLDLQWARAIAPGAKIVLVQADSNITPDIYQAIRKASNMAKREGGGVVSMSLGINYTYDPGVSDYDPTTFADMYLWDKLFRSYRTVTYVAASGDYGASVVSSWPAMSPYVTAVGGTALQLDQDGNPLAEEAAWINGGSGYALPDWYERPSYQDGIGYIDPDPDWDPDMTDPVPDDVRGIPDVSYNADPATPYAIYTTTPIGGSRGWFTTGGTSAGAPQWAAIVAIANAKRAAAGKAVIGNKLNGVVYDIYNGFAGEDGPNQEYADCFSDIIVGQAGPWFAIPRYDMATGVGTPKAGNLINAMVNYDGFFLQDTFTFEGRLFMPPSVAMGGLFPATSGQLHTGTGVLAGTDQLLVTFLTDPVRWYGPNFTPVIVGDEYYDLEGPPGDQSSPFRVQLQRSGRGQSSGRIYGIGTADIFNADPRITFGAATFTLQFDGRWWKGKDGQVHYHIEFRAVDPVTYDPLESRVTALVLDPSVPWLGAYFEGEING